LTSLGIAAFALPTQCAPGAGKSGECLPAAASIDVAQPQVQPKPAPVAAAKPVAPLAAKIVPVAIVPVAASVSTPAPQPEPGAMPTAQGLIAATFDRLQQGSSTLRPNSRVAVNTTPKPVATAPLAPAQVAPATPPASPTSRLVSTTVVRADAPIVVAEANTNTNMSTQTPGPVLAPAKPVVAPAPVASAPPAAPAAKVLVAARDMSPPAKPEAAAPSSGMMLIGGQGVTVRSGPSKSNGALFALAAGQKVTVKSNQKGWLQIVDAQGRTGWAYSALLIKQ
jgi:hypothetical protein